MLPNLSSWIHNSDLIPYINTKILQYYVYLEMRIRHKFMRHTALHIKLHIHTCEPPRKSSLGEVDSAYVDHVMFQSHIFRCPLASRSKIRICRSGSI